MPHFFIILLKINLVLILFAAAYYFILRRLTFYVINRVFLVFGILFSTLYPFIDLTDFFNNQNQQLVAFVPELNQKVKTMVPLDFISNYWLWITILFYAGVIFMAFRLIVQFVSLYRMHKKSLPGAIANFKVRILDEPVSPFSFWQTVYINPTLHKERELQTILTHEHIHVKQWHSLDIILAELSVVFYWFNPGVWLMKRAVKENLEFITDQKILNKGVDKKAYQYSLLDVGNLIPAVEIVNNFNLSDLKKRIKMMNAKRSSKFTLSRYLLVLPVLLLTTLAFTVTKKDIKKHLNPIALVLEDAVSNDTSQSVLDIPIKNNESVSTKKNNLKAVNTEKKIQVININFKFKDTLSDEMDEVTKQLFIQMATQRAQQGDTAQLSLRTVHGMALDDKQAAFILAKTKELSIADKDKPDTKKLSFVGTTSQAIALNEKQTVSVIVKNDEMAKLRGKVVDYVTVTGYATNKKVAGQDLGKGKVILKGANLPADSAKVKAVSYYINGKKVESVDISIDDIKAVNVRKTKKGNEILIIAEKKP